MSDRHPTPRESRTNVTASEITPDVDVARRGLDNTHASIVSALRQAHGALGQLVDLSACTAHRAVGFAIADVESAFDALNRAAVMIDGVSHLDTDTVR